MKRQISPTKEDKIVYIQLHSYNQGSADGSLMTQNTDLESLLKKLTVPAQDLAQLSFCRSAKENQIKDWLRHLPLTQAQQVSAQLYTAVHELSRHPMSCDQRWAILELLRNTVSQTLNGLASKYLNQPLILPEAALKTATIAQAIQKHFLNGYLIVVRQLCNKIETKKESQHQQALAIERALAGLGQLLLRSYQLYLPIASKTWIEIHSLYQLACLLGVEQEPIEDSLPHQHGLRTVHNHYLRLLLLAAARPNQLRQSEIEHTYNLLEVIAQSAELNDYAPERKENLFVVLPHSNSPPIYKSHWRPSSPAEQTGAHELSTSHLISHLESICKPIDEHSGQTIAVAAPGPALKHHLEQAWSHLALRSFERQDVNAEIEITVGLTNIHFHIADEQAFNVFLNRTSGLASAPEKGDIFQKRGVALKKNTKALEEDDPWDDAFEISGTALDGKTLPTLNIEKKILEQDKMSYQGQHPVYQVPLVDRSPGGYGLEWRGAIPAQVRTGELVGIREYGRKKWSIGVVRWAHQIKGATQLGIQLLAPQAMPVGIAMVHKTGGYSEYLRALQIPEMRALNQPASLITNAVSFHEYNKARLYSQPAPGVSYAGDKSIQLTQRLFTTSAFSQFSFRELMDTSADPKANKDDFDSVWE